MTVLDFDTRDAWLTARSEGVGATDAAAILGLSPWRGQLETYCEKLSIAPADQTEVERMEWGLLLQPVIAAKYARETGRTVIDPGPYNIHRSDDYPWMQASLDALVDAPDKGRGVLEIKTTSGMRADDWIEDAPLHVQIQLQHQLAVTGLQWGSLAVLIGGQRFLWLDIPRNEEFIAAMIATELAFWQMCERREPPPPDATESCKALLKRLYPREAPGKVVALTGDALKWDAQRMEAKKALEDAQRLCLEAENNLIAALGDAEVGLMPDGTRYSYKSQNRKGYTVEPATFRVLRRSAAR
jgi:putative phage-type endonuclease